MNPLPLPAPLAPLLRSPLPAQGADHQAGGQDVGAGQAEGVSAGGEQCPGLGTVLLDALRGGRVPPVLQAGACGSFPRHPAPFRIRPCLPASCRCGPSGKRRRAARLQSRRPCSARRRPTGVSEVLLPDGTVFAMGRMQCSQQARYERAVLLCCIQGTLSLSHSHSASIARANVPFCQPTPPPTPPHPASPASPLPQGTLARRVVKKTSGGRCATTRCARYSSSRGGQEPGKFGWLRPPMNSVRPPCLQPLKQSALSDAYRLFVPITFVDDYMLLRSFSKLLGLLHGRLWADANVVHATAASSKRGHVFLALPSSPPLHPSHPCSTCWTSQLCYAATMTSTTSPRSASGSALRCGGRASGCPST